MGKLKTMISMEGRMLDQDSHFLIVPLLAARTLEPTIMIVVLMVMIEVSLWLR